MALSPFAQVSSTVIKASHQSDFGSLHASEIVALVAAGPPPSRYLSVANLSALASAQQDNVMLEVSDVVILASFVERGTERLNSRAWGFNFDQHQFYVAHLGEEGTFVYDILTGQWAKWETAGYSTWNAENGIEWNNEVYFGDNTGPTLWKLDPDSYLDDDFRLITRVVTGGIPAEARETIRTGMFVLSVTKQGEIDDESTPSVQLSLSADGGFSWNDRDAITINSAELQDFSWRSLGIIKSPGRVYKVTDTGAFVTIKGADQKLGGED